MKWTTATTNVCAKTSSATCTGTTRTNFKLNPTPCDYEVFTGDLPAPNLGSLFAAEVSKKTKATNTNSVWLFTLGFNWALEIVMTAMTMNTMAYSLRSNFLLCIVRFNSLLGYL